jgi:hypothetical protein
MTLILSNCESLIAKKNTYAAAGPSRKVNGAAVRMQVNSQGTAHGIIAYSSDRKNSSVSHAHYEIPDLLQVTSVNDGKTWEEIENPSWD